MHGNMALHHGVLEIRHMCVIGNMQNLQKARKVKSISQVKDGDSYVGLIGRCPCCGDILEEDTVYCDCGQRLDCGDEE